VAAAYSYLATVARRLPAPIFRVVRAGGLSLLEFGRLTSNLFHLVMPSTRAADASDPFAIVDRRALRSIYWSFVENPQELLQVRTVRQILARERLKVLTETSDVRTASDTGSVIHNGVQYNVDGAKSAPDLDRPALMVNVVSSIERVWKNIGALDVLSIGPRSEIEIFSLLAAGFKRERVRALDLLSYSPYVEIGNMHAMPYANDSFDVILLGWVLAYSRDPASAAREIVRVCRNGAIVVASADYVGERTVDTVSNFNNEETRIRSVDQILGYFGAVVGPVYFRHDPELPDRNMVMTAFEVRKKMPGLGAEQGG